jgi:hypothetical protein
LPKAAKTALVVAAPSLRAAASVGRVTCTSRKTCRRAGVRRAEGGRGGGEGGWLSDGERRALYSRRASGLIQGQAWQG